MDIKVPDLGVESAEVAEIFVVVGDNIAKDDNIVLLESDKASVEVPSSVGGKVTAINISVGDHVKEGDTLMSVEVDEAVKDQDNNADGATDKKSQDNNHNTKSTHANEAHDQSESLSQLSQDQSKDDTTIAEQTFTLPDLGVQQAEVAEVMVEKGDTVVAEQSLILIESDKAAVEVPAPVAGEVVAVLVNAGDTVTNGQEYIVIASRDSANKADDDINNTDKTDVNNTDTKNTNTNEQQTDGNLQPTDTQSGKESTQTYQSDLSSSTKLTEAQVNEKLTDVYAGPAVRKLARQLGVDITKVTGSATNGRLVKEDLFAHVNLQLNRSNQIKDASNAQQARPSGLPNLPDMSKAEIWGEFERQDLSRLQKVSIPQLTYNTYLPQVTQFDLADITDTENLRGELKGEYKQQGIGLTILAFIVKASAYALTQYPRFNSHLSDDQTQIIVRKTVNMGIAVATDDGLIVPVIKNAQNKGIKQLAIEIGELADKARDKKLTTAELQGASFTISSQGNLGGTYFTPLVNWPQVAILGISEASMQPRWHTDKRSFEPRLMLPLSLSYDHRVINGADAAVFTRYIAKLLADPRLILL